MASRSRKFQRLTRPVASPTGNARRRFRFRPSLLMLEPRTLLSTFQVTNTNDSGSGSLRSEISQAKNGDTIDFAPSLFGGGQQQTITLTSGTLNITTNVSILGPGANLLTISGNHSQQVFDVTGGSTTVPVELADLTIASGNSSTGGGVENSGTLTLYDCTISGNSSNYGGGFYNSSAGSLSLYGCLITANSAVDGGGITNKGTLKLGQSTVAKNSAILNGGAFYDNNNGSSLTLDACTVAGNSAQAMGGISPGTFLGTVTMDNTIVAENPGGDYIGPGAGSYNNLIGDGGVNPGGGDFTNGVNGNIVGTNADPVNPLLAALGDYGGPTPTMALLPGSPAIGKGKTVSGTMTDQRGFALDSPTPDIGAFQTQPGIIVNSAIDGVGSPLGALSLRQAINLADVQGRSETISFDLPGSTLQPFTTINLSSPLPTITSDLTIDGGANNNKQPGGGVFFNIYSPVEISGGNQYQILNIASGANVQLEGLALANGSSSTFGGAILNQGTLTITSSSTQNQNTGLDTTSMITDSSAAAGGAIFNEGMLSILSNSTISGCSSTESGAAICNEGTVTITSSTISGCSSLAAGGAIENLGGTVVIDGSSMITGNQASVGGAIDQTGVLGSLTISSSTVSNNLASGRGATPGIGGGLYIRSGTANLEDHTTLSGNTAQGANGGTGQAGGAADGGAIALNGGGAVTITDSTLSGNSARGGQGGGGLVGGTGGVGGAADGGAIALSGGGGVTITDSTLSGNSAQGGEGGTGYAGAHGADQGIAPWPQSGAQGGDGTAGGPAGPGSTAQGGGIYVGGGALNLIGSTLANNVATGGSGGPGGLGGGGGHGGTASNAPRATAGALAFDDGPPGGAGGNGAKGGPAGAGGKGAGGGVYVQASAIVGVINSTLASNQAVGGAGGNGGAGGAGGHGGNGGASNSSTLPSGVGGAGGNGGNGGADGAVGDASGAGIENAGGTLTVHDATIADNQSKGGAAGTVGAGGQFGIWGLNSPGTFLDLKLTYDSDGNVIGYTSAPAGYTPPLGNKGIPGAPSTTVPVVVGGGIAADSGGVTLTNTLVAANTAGGSASDISGTVDTSSSRYNLIGTGGSGGLVDQSTDPADHNQVGVSDPGLGTLADNGGPTQTIALLSTSPAIAAGNAALATDLQGNTLTIDQRGDPRFVAGFVDIGAYEFNPQPGSTLVVSTLADQNAVGMSLRVAMIYASADGGANTITFASGLSGTIVLGGSELPAVTGNPTVQGNPEITVSGAGQSRIFEVDTGGTLNLTGLALTDGSAGLGGAILDNGGTLNISGSTLSGNIARGSTGNSGGPARGGAIAIDGGSVTITASTIKGNTAGGGDVSLLPSAGVAGGDGAGGGIAVSGGTLKLINSLVENNVASGGQGGHGSGGVTQYGFHVFSDSAGPGGAGHGGGIAVSGGVLDLISSLVANNVARGGEGGGGEVAPTPFGGQVPVSPGAGGAADGGGLYMSAGLLSVTDSIAANNTAQGGAGGPNNGSGSPGAGGTAAGGGIGHDGGTLYLINATVAYNEALGGSGTSSTPAAGGGGIAAGNGAGDGVDFAAPVVSLANTLVALNTAGGSASDISGSVGTQALYSQNNLIGTGGAGGLKNGSDGNQVGVASPGITQLIPGNGPNGLETIALLRTSPAITAGSVSRAVDRFGNPLATDEVGDPRILQGTVDIGAFEAGTQSLVVTTLVDQDALTSNPGVGAGTSLREAINYAEELGGAPTITFAAGLTGTITLGGSELPVITGNVSIVGPGADQLTISGNSISRILEVAVGATASVSGLTFAMGSAGTSGDGGAISNAGTLTVNSTTFDSNSANSRYNLPGGGGIYNDGTLTVNNSTFEGNSTVGFGGGIFNSGTLWVNSSTFHSNSAGNEGGGIENYSRLATLWVFSSTFDSNSAVIGGGIDDEGGIATVFSSTFDSNHAASAGGIEIDGEVNLTNTIVAENPGGDINTNVPYGNGNLIGGNPMLGPLQYNGGPTQTRVPLPGSPAIGHGGALNTLAASGVADTTSTAVTLVNNSGLPATLPALPSGDYFVIQVDSEQMAVTALTFQSDGTIRLTVVRGANGTTAAIHAGGASVWLAFDQRGFARSAASPDIGAFQTESNLVVNNATDGTSQPLPPGQLSLRQAVSLAGVLGAAATITFDPTAFAAHQTIELTSGPLELSDTRGLQTITGPAAGVTLDAGGQSGVFLMDSGVTASLSGLTITGGSATGYFVSGGGIFNSGDLTLAGCTLSGNSADYGGGIFNSGELTLTDCTISGNSARSSGGGVYNYGTATLTGCTVSGNSAYLYGGGVDFSSGALAIGDTILAGNTASFGPDLYGAIPTDLGHNLIGGDPLLAPLGDYGGPTATMPLLRGSPAIGQGAAMGQATDQRGFALDSPQPDIGAFQTQPGLVVNTTIDGAGSPAGELSLRQAVNLADVLGAAATITFDPTAFAAHQTITLTAGPLELSGTGGLAMITGPTAGLTLDAGGLSGVFRVDKGVTASLSGLSLTGGSATFGGGAANYGDLTLAGCTVSGNSAQYSGGGIVSAGDLTLTGCTVSGNSAGNNGGGIANYAQMTLTACTISGNSARSSGGGVYAFGGAAALVDCTIAANTAGVNGGGLFDVPSIGPSGVQGTLTLTACTVSGNTAVTGQVGGGGGGVYIAFHAKPTLVDTIVAGNAGFAGANDLGGEGTAAGSYDLIGTDGTGSLVNGQDGNIVGVADPLLAPLGDYGGPTQTMALLPGSPAIGQGAAMGLTTDQRNLPLDAPNPDIGAFQSQGFILTPVAGSTPQSALINTAFGQPLELTVTANNPIEPVDGGVISFTAPSSGASAALSAGTATIASGQADVTATANASAGSYTVTVSAGGSSAASFSLTNFVPVTITPAGPLAGTAGVAYKQALSAAGGEGGPFTFAVTTGALPAGFTLSSGGTLSGTDTTATTDTFTVTATGLGGFSGSQAYSLTINPAPTSLFVVTGFPTPVTAGVSGSFTVTAEDAYGNTTPGYAGTVKFTSSDGQASLPAKATLTSGTGSFTATLRTAGSQSITATDSVTGSITGSQTGITVNPALTSQFLVRGFPTPVTAGKAGSFTVTAKDAYGNTTPGYAGTVKFTSSDGQAVLPAKATLTNGTGSFSATLKTAGSQSITATDTVTGSITGSQTGITVNPAAATRLSIGGPSSVKSGTAFTITVTALDPYNNVAAGYRGTVHFTSSDPRAVLPENYLFTAGDGGAHTFTNGVTLKKTGTQTITVWDKANKSITGSLSISVGKAAPAAMALSGMVGGVTAMGPLPSDVALEIGSGDGAAGAAAADDGGVGVDGTQGDDKLAALDAVLAAWDSRERSGVEDGTA